MTGSGVARERASARPIELAAVFVAGAIGPLTWLGASWPGRPAVVLVICVAVGVGLVGVLAALWLTRIFGPEGHLASVPLILMIGNWGLVPGLLADPLSWLGPLAPVVPTVVVGALMLRLRTFPWFSTVISAVLFGVAGATAVTFIGGVMTPTETLDVPELMRGSVELGDRDVFMVVLDAHARSDVLRESYGYDPQPFLDRLHDAGLIENDVATAPYSMTYASLAATLTGSYVISEGVVLGATHRRALYDLISGASPVVSEYRSSGYEYVHIESGWGGTRCGQNVDRCVVNPWTETLDRIADRSVFGGVVSGIVGSSFSRASLAALDHLEAEVLRSGDRPRFVFAHVLIPHPPLNVSAECAVVVAPDLGGLSLTGRTLAPDVLALRRAAYLDQTRCVDTRVADIVEQIPEDAIVIVMSDHGPDGNGQLELAPFAWTRGQIDERLSAFMAVRFPPGCDPQPAYGVNLFRVLLACQSGVKADLLPQRSFVVNLEEGSPFPVVEVEPPPGPAA